MDSTRIEFSVQMTCENCVNAVKSSLSQLDGIRDINISLERGTVVVDTDLPYSLIQEKIESTGKRAVLKGYGGADGSAVAMLGGDSGYSIGDRIRGVVRFVQASNGCVIDGTMDGLNPGLHGLHIHECGDISKGCDSVGDHFNPYNTPHGAPENQPTQRHIGDLGNIHADESGRATFRMEDHLLKVWDVIGRSLVVTEEPDDLGKGNSPRSKLDGNSGTRLACGIIARSSGLFDNVKKICECSGMTLWDERDKVVNVQQGKNPKDDKTSSNSVCSMF